MSGAEDLARLTVTIDILNEITISPEIKDVDVGNGEARPTVTKALSIAATQFGGAMPYTSIEEALTNTITGTVFSVPSQLASPPDPLKYIDMYLNDGGVAVPLGDYPSGAALRAISELVQGVSSLPVASEEAALALTDEEGGEFLSITPSRTRTPSIEAITHDTDSGLYDSEGGATIHAGVDGLSVGPLMIGLTALPGIYVVDAEDNILQELSDPGAAPISQATMGTPLADGAYFAPKLVTGEGFPLRINVSSLISNRDLAGGLVASIWSTTTEASDTSNSELVVQCSEYGAAARLKLRDPLNGFYQKMLDLQMVDLPIVSTAGASPSVLLIGDSISNRQGAQIMDASLQRLGRAANWIGTIAGSGVENQAYNETGPLGEAREAYETANFTYSTITEITIPVPAGGEAEYLAMSKIERRNRNPFIRPTVAEDDPLIVRNGYVLDFAFYQSRFNLPAPDVILYGLGMNDFGKLSDTTSIQNYVNDNEGLMFSRMRAAWPNAKILRFLPGLPYQAARNMDWTAKYIPLIRAVMSLHKALANQNTVIVPSWAFADPEVGYQTSVVTIDPVTGFSTAQISDNTHPGQANRRRLFGSIGPYISAAHLGLI